jgi:hypothetical protein
MVGTLVLLSAAACADLDVTNPNSADAQRALQTAGDVEALISGSFNTWHTGNADQNGAGNFLSNASFQHSAPWANFCMEEYARIPRIPLVNETAHGCYGNFSSPWINSYRALSAASDGLKALNDNPELAEELGADATRRAEAFARFIQGISHAQIAILYDQGWVIDETTDILNPGDPVEPATLLATAMDQLDAAISLAGQGFGDEDIPAGWLRSEADLSPAEFARIAHSMKARYRASLPRSPSDDVDWDQVIADVDAGITEDFIYRAFASDGWGNGVVFRTQISGWAEVPYFIWGMADQSGNYDTWESLALGDKDANVDGVPMLIVTPDLRFAQGSTVEEQQENPGVKFASPTNIGSVWAQPGRGTWRWSYYRIHHDAHYWESSAETSIPLITVEEMQLLKAEALLDAGQTGAAVDIINETRVAAGLNATDASGTNTDCVPRLAGGECGDLFEMFKWEKRLESLARGPLHVAMYFDSRRWGDLYEGTYLQFPAPCQDMEIVGAQCTTYGGVGGEMASPGSSYNFTTEGG